MKVVAINIAPGSRLPMRSVDAVEAEAGLGLVGDRYHGSSHLHVTIQSQEMLALAAAELGYEFDPSGTRRNITVDSGDLPTRHGSRLMIGHVELEVVRPSVPCRLLDDSIGRGAASALRGRTGSICRVLTSGTIRVGATVSALGKVTP
ncbi:MOSC domain-containing protein [soil metagenome]